MRMLSVSVIPIANGARLPARPATAVLSTTVTRKKPSRASIMKPAAGVIVRDVAPRTRLCASAGVPRPVSGSPKYCPQQQRTGDTANELTDDVADRLTDADRAGDEDADSDGGVHVAARNGAVGEGEGHDGQTVGERNRDDAGQADTIADHGCGAGTDKYERESADELSKEFWCNPVGHC